MRPAIRLAALMKLHSIYVFTHDSIGLGEDGPTHQPIEHAAALRAIPRLTVIRPADANETAGAWRVAHDAARAGGARCSRGRRVPVLAGTGDVARGGYVLADADGRPDVILIATGSEVSLALEARAQLAGRGIKARVVSLPSWELFDAQPQEYRDAVLPPDVLARVAVEAGVPQGWEKYVGAFGAVVGDREPLRRLGPAQGRDGEVRLHRCQRGREGRRGRRAAAGEARRLRAEETLTSTASATNGALIRGGLRPPHPR